MPSVALDELCRVAHLPAPTSQEQVNVSSITHDSRLVGPGSLFVCLAGAKHDGHAFAMDAIARGARALVVDAERAASVAGAVPLVVVPSTRNALAPLSAAFHGWPSRKLTLIGVTGTNGKTTTTRLTAAILRAAGQSVGTVGTLGAEIDGRPIDSSHTTPEADQLQSILALMVAEGADACVMEASSHAIDQHRCDALCFSGAVFTNLTQDHLDYHGTLDNYFQAKRKLFTGLAEPGDRPMMSAVNVDDPYGRRLAVEAQGNVVTYGLEDVGAQVRGSGVICRPESTEFRLSVADEHVEVRLQIGGAFQVYNALAAAAVCIGLGVDLPTVARGLGSVAGVPGRFESVPNTRGLGVVVDYAHTPDGLRNVLTSARGLSPARLIIVFGCGGNRDRTKRPIMGSIAGELADMAIVTSDNPRHENPDEIIAEIMAGTSGAVARVLVEPDRRSAIELALREAAQGDLVVIAGKGHEDYQLVGDAVLPFDDRQVALELLGA